MFTLNYNTDLHILHYPNLQAKGTDEVTECTWAEWCERLTHPKVSSLDKYRNGLVIYGDVDDGVDERTGEILPHRRENQYVMYRQVFSLDYDEIEDMEQFLNNIKSKMHHFAYFMYSTYRHRDTHDEHDKQLRPRFRLLVPVDDILEPEEYKKIGGGLARYIGEKLDESCLTPVQLSALPTVYDKKVPFHWFINDAPFITREQLENCLKKYPEPEEKIILTTDYSGNSNKRSDEHWKEIMKAGLGESEGRTQQLTSLIGHLQQHYVNHVVALELVKLWNEQHAVPLSDEKIEYTYSDLYKRNKRKRKRY